MRTIIFNLFCCTDTLKLGLALFQVTVSNFNCSQYMKDNCL